MSKEARIRPATADDSEAIARLSGQLGYPATAEEIRERLEMAAANPRHTVLVAEAGNEVAGWAHVLVDLHLESGVFAELAGLVVDERRRGAGIGRKLVEAAEHWSRRQGCTSLRVRTNVLRTETHRFYERVGFEVVKEQRVFKKNLTK